MNKNTFTIKDSKERKQFDSGMQRDVTSGKIDFSLAFDGVMFKRYAEHLTKGAEKYEKRNWLKATGKEELERFKESAVRHFIQWFYGEVDEDHASAVFFNINGYETLKEKMNSEEYLYQEALKREEEAKRKYMQEKEQEEIKRKKLEEHKINYPL